MKPSEYMGIGCETLPLNSPGGSTLHWDVEHGLVCLTSFAITYYYSYHIYCEILCWSLVAPYAKSTPFTFRNPVVSNTGMFDRGLTHLLHSELHWLDVSQRILHKLGVTVHQCLQGKAPQYLVNCCRTSEIASRQRLRSSSCHLHHLVPRHRRSTLGRQAFSVAGPMAWNALHDDLRDPLLSVDNFRKTLKTHLFRNALGHLAH